MFSHPSLKNVFRVTAVAGLLLCAAPSFAAETQTCEDQGLNTWSFHSSFVFYGSGTAPHEVCRQSWDDFAEDRSGTGSYWYTVTQIPSWSNSGFMVACYTCTGELVTAPVANEPLPVGMGDAGLIGGKLLGGTAVGINRLDSWLDTGRSVYLVDVVGPEGRSQVVVDGTTGEARHIEDAVNQDAETAVEAPTAR